jgi:hypothetical protein
MEALCPSSGCKTASVPRLAVMTTTATLIALARLAIGLARAPSDDRNK